VKSDFLDQPALPTFQKTRLHTKSCALTAMKPHSRNPLRKNPVTALVLFTALAISISSLSAAGTRVSFEIDAGNGKTHPVIIELDETNTPLTAANFKKLVAEDFYKGIAIHRVVPNYIVQMGDPLTKDAARKGDWGTGGPGYTVPAETGQKHLRGSVAMARLSDGVNPSRASSGSQFYVCLTDMPALDGDYTVFGKVVSGLEHFDRISQVAADTNNNPITRIALIDTSVVAEPGANPGTSLASALTSMPRKPTASAPGTAAPTTESPSNTAMAATPTPPTATPSSSATSALPSVTSIGATATPSPADRAGMAADSSTSSTLAMANAAASDAAAVVESASSGAGAPTSSSSSGSSDFSALVAEARAQAGKMIDSDPTDPADSEAALAAAAAAEAASDADADAIASMPDRSSDSSDVTAALTQPVAERTPVATGSNLAADTNAPRPGNSAPSKPKKPEGFFTRMIKKVW